MLTHRLMLATALFAYLLVGFFTSSAQADNRQSRATQKLCKLDLFRGQPQDQWWGDPLQPPGERP